MSVAEKGPLGSVERHVLDSLLEGCQVVGFDYTYLYLNDAAAAHGRQPKEALLGRTMMECYPGIDQAPFFPVLARCMTERKPERMENEFTYPDGSIGWFELRFLPVPDGVCILSMDVTERKRSAAALARSEEQLRQAQKMEAVGRLAGGVAHDFNNLLSVVLSYGALVLEDLPDDAPIRPDVEEICRAGTRATELTRQLLTFSRQQMLAPRVLDLNAVLGSMDKMLHRILGEDIDLVCLPAPSLGRVEVDPSAIEQVVMNLVVNARDAMPKGGKLTLETGELDLDEDYAREHLGVVPGRYVMLAVSDTGIGMDRETQARIFDPFFTTKERGKGTGLGLSMVFGIVRQSGGSVWVYSEPGRGTTFKVYLPRVEAAPESIDPAPAPDGLRGTETILVVEDEAQVLGVVASILRRHGYEVIEASHPGDAVLAAERHAGRIHLLLSDVVMPEMSGPDLARHLTTQRPDMKVLCMSGYTDDSIVRHGILAGGIAFLQKPIRPDALTKKVRQVLEAE